MLRGSICRDSQDSYGSGNCDREALLTLPNGQTKVIKLHR